MVDSRVKNVSAAFSWADEVEREEEEQARFQEHQKQKPDPFGSARPREVVLLEKGIDWRKLDIHLQQPSHKRQLDPPYGKQCKENIPAFAAPGIDRIPSVTPSKSLKTELEDANSELKRSETLRVPLATESQIPATFVPPLRYPPKNVIPSLSESGFHYYLHEQGFQSKMPLKPGKENTFHQQVPQGDRCFQKLNQGSHTRPRYHRQILQAEQRSQMEDKISFRLWRSDGSGKNLRKPAASRLQQDSDSATENPSKNLQGNDAAWQNLTKSSCARGTNIKQKNGLERSIAVRDQEGQNSM